MLHGCLVTFLLSTLFLFNANAIHKDSVSLFRYTCIDDLGRPVSCGPWMKSSSGIGDGLLPPVSDGQ